MRSNSIDMVGWITQWIPLWLRSRSRLKRRWLDEAMKEAKTVGLRGYI